MSRPSRSAAAVLSAFVLSLAFPAGTAFADRTPPPASATPPPAAATAAAPTATTTASAPTATARPTSEPDKASPSSTTSRPAAKPPKPTSSQAPSTTPRPSASAADFVDVRLSVWFDKPSYTATEQITVHAKATNTGTVTARSVSLVSSGNLSSTWWSHFSPLGVPIEPGQAVEGSADGYVTTAAGALTITVSAVVSSDQKDADPADNTVTVSVPVAHPVGSYRGTVYGDANGNGVLDRGEALAGAKVDVAGGVPDLSYSTTTDDSGRFVFSALPAGSYWARFTKAGWYVPDQRVEIGGAHDPDVLARGVPAVGDRLAASMAFNRQSYRKNEVPHLRVTLANNGTALLTNLTASCWVNGQGKVAAGDLAVGGPGAAVPAGKKRVFDLTIRITGEMVSEGYLRAYCTIGAPPYSNGSVGVRATAAIPGGMAPAIAGGLYVFRGKNPTEPPWGDPLPGVKIYLRNQITGVIAARAVSGRGGGFTFYRVPAGVYSVGVVGPWQVVYPVDFVVRDGVNGIDPLDSYAHQCFVVPGPYQPDPDSGPPSSGARPAPAHPRPAAPAAAAPATTPSHGLAETGVEVTWLALGAFLTTVLGAALVLGAYRRRWR
ncbi:carboxypeptidase regulatory-like domain-containing protein [Amycolatopsis sp. NPDC054798]